MQVSISDPAIAAEPKPERLVYLGDSITDGNTYPLLIDQALRDAGKPIGVWFNAGIGGNTSKDMLARLDRDVFAHKPTLVTINAGINDTFNPNISLADYQKNLRAIVEAVQANGAEPILVTTSVLRNKSAPVQEKLAGINQAIRDLATEKKCRLADVYVAMDRQPDAAATLLVEDGVHPNFQGQAVIARTLLDTLGHQQIPLPKRLSPEMMPGVITQWHTRPAAKDEPELTESIAVQMKHETCVGTLNLPGAPIVDMTDWFEQERACGFAINLHLQIAPGERFFSIANVKATEAGPALLKAGASLEKVYLNGKQVYSDPLPGWHAGRDRVTVNLKQGENRLVIESGRHFFLSLTHPTTGQSAMTPAPNWPATVADTMNDGRGRDNTGWVAAHQKFSQIAGQDSTKIIFIGDSITDYWRLAGEQTWNREFAPLGAANFGIAGDETQHVLWRLRQGELQGSKAGLAVLLIGSNNLGVHPDHTPEQVAHAIGLSVKEFQQRVPGIKVLVLGILPRGEGDAKHPLRQRITAANKLIAKLADDKSVFYMDLTSVFTLPDGKVNRTLIPDWVHPGAEGYVAFAKAIKPTIEKLQK
jgi:lysophospholipase L1-like esterase